MAKCTSNEFESHYSRRVTTQPSNSQVAIKAHFFAIFC
ncbi:hypothetical protein Z949_235 [Sulfitobacter guttiformis KCTC 32187]|nr:hypothetical protein Z949_235 [Sulfitobacter guttiformis KCTC 32187]